MGILEGKNILVTGVLTEGSIAFDVARLSQEQGAHVVLSGESHLAVHAMVAADVAPARLRPLGQA